MSEKNMKELNLDEMDKVSGGNDAECLHRWKLVQSDSVKEIWQCIYCNARDTRFNSRPAPGPDPRPRPV